jgi:glycine/D-amino acid oxidase-like deaminating enzyme
VSGSAIIVGGGIVGAACAEALVRDGWRVTVIERSFVAAGATSAAMGHLVVMDDSPAQLALTAHGVRLWRALRDSLPTELEWLSSGTLWIAEDDAQLEAAAAKRDVYRDAGVAAELLDGRQLAEAEAELRSGLAGALRVPDDAVLYPPAAARILLERARTRGAELVEGSSVLGVSAHAVKTDGTTRNADVIVLATGASSAALIPELPIVPRKGHLVVTDRYPALCRHQLVELGYLASAHSMSGDGSVAFNVQPRATGQVLIGSSRELVEWDASINRNIVRQMVDRAVSFMPVLANVNALRVWTGFRPATPDSLPLIGPWRAFDGVWIAAGHEGLGVTMALATAQLIADMLAGRRPAVDPQPYAPERVRVPHDRSVAHA